MTCIHAYGCDCNILLKAQIINKTVGEITEIMIYQNIQIGKLKFSWVLPVEIID